MLSRAAAGDPASWLPRPGHGAPRLRPRLPRAVGLVRVALALVALAPAGARTWGQSTPAGEVRSGPDTTRPRPHPRDRVTFLQDARLRADSTLFPYDWPALEGLRVALARLRPALESGSVRELSEALPELQARVDTLAADTIPSLLAPRSREVRDRVTLLSEALRRAEELAPVALAAPPDTAAGEGETGFVALPGGGGAAEGAAGGAPVLASPSAAESAGVSTTPPPAAPDSLSADPVAAYLQAWRDVYAHEEALLHRVRDPFGS